MNNFTCKQLHPRHEMDITEISSQLRKNFRAWAIINPNSMSYKEYLSHQSNAIIDDDNPLKMRPVASAFVVGTRATLTYDITDGTKLYKSFNVPSVNKSVGNALHGAKRVFFQDEFHVGLLMNYTLTRNSDDTKDDTLYAMFMVIPKCFFIELLSVGKTLETNDENSDETIVKLIHEESQVVMYDILGDKFYYPNPPSGKVYSSDPFLGQFMPCSGARTVTHNPFGVVGDNLIANCTLGSYFYKSIHELSDESTEYTGTPTLSDIQALYCILGDENRRVSSDDGLSSTIPSGRIGEVINQMTYTIKDEDEREKEQRKLNGRVHSLVGDYGLPPNIFHESADAVTLVSRIMSMYIEVLHMILPTASMVKYMPINTPMLEPLLFDVEVGSKADHTIDVCQYVDIPTEADMVGMTVQQILGHYTDWHDLWDGFLIPLYQDKDKIIDYFMGKIHAQS